MPRIRTTTPPQSRSSNWCITVNNPTEDPDTWSARLRTHSQFKYMVFQAETGDGGTFHYQAYAEFAGAIRFTTLKSLLPGAHIEPRKGTALQAAEYCKKAETRKEGPWEYGELSTKRQGKRLDLEKLAKMAQENSHVEILKEMPREYAKFYKFVQHVKHIEALDKPGIRNNLEVLLFYGPTRTGKTHRAYKIDPNLYALPVGKDLWFDNYNGEKTVLLDDFSGQCRLVDLLRILDKYPVQIPRKGGFIWLKATTIIITCNQHPDDWYDYSNRDSLRSALMARFTRCLRFTEERQRKGFILGDPAGPTKTAYQCDVPRSPQDAQQQEPLLRRNASCDTIELSSDTDDDSDAEAHYHHVVSLR